MDSVGKVCSKCKQWKSADDFYMKVKETGKLYSQCKSCAYETQTNYRKKNMEKYAAIAVEKYHAEPDKFRARSKKYRQLNLETVRAKDREHDAKRRERRAEYRQLKAEHRRAYNSKRKAENKDKVNAQTQKRRCRLKGNGGSYTAEEWKELKASYGNRCLMCKRPEPEVTLCVDHVVPVIEGGSNDITNLQPLCRSCNSKKHRKVLDLRQARY